MRIKNAVVSAASRARIAGLSHERLKLDQKKGAQLPPFPTTLVAPDPEDATSTILELDERMARLCSKKPTTPGFGLPSAERAGRWSPMQWVIGANGRASGCGRPFPTAIVLVTAKRLSGRLIKR